MNSSAVHVALMFLLLVERLLAEAVPTSALSTMVVATSACSVLTYFRMR